MKKHSALSLNRRQFIQRTPRAWRVQHSPGAWLSGAEVSPNAKLNVAASHWQAGRSRRGRVAGLGHNFVALCDVDDKYAAKSSPISEGQAVQRYRVMLDKMGKEIEAVVIGTPDHTHAVIDMERCAGASMSIARKPLPHRV